MARKCCVLSCDGDVREARAKGLPLHKFPKDADLRSRWLTSGGFDTNFKPTAGQLVCHRHFKSTDYENVKGQKFLLKRGTVPSIFSDYDNHPDPVIISMKTISYPQEDLDLINSEISNLDKSLVNSEIKEEIEEEIKSKDVKNESENTDMNEEKKDDKASDTKPKHINKGGLSFFPGAKLEAKDFNEKWYSARVVETDWVEQEVLIHFDKWSSRFDEWIPMDSSRLRVLQVQPSEQPWMLSSPDTKPREFSVGERVLATWADGRKYPAKVSSVLGNDRYNVLFDDGYAKIVKSSKMTKIAGTVEKSTEGDNYIGSKQERRDKKRKHSVMELFSTHTRKRPKVEGEKAKKDGVLNKDGKEKEVTKNETEQEDQFLDAQDNSISQDETSNQKTKSYSKKNKRESTKNDTDYEDDVHPEWINGEPQGTEAFIVEGSDGPRRSIIVPDKKLPPGWQKHFTQRKTGSSAGKWDVFFVHDLSGKKFRSRNEIKSYMESLGQLYVFDPDKFDFCIHRKKKPLKIKQEPDVKKIKTLLPKTKACGTPDATSPNGVSLPSSTPLPIVSPDDNAVFIGGLRVEMEDSAYKCPKEGCNKNFRKENLLQMHIKHYHPEYSKFLGSTPNVADLAYARTIGESIEDIIPKKSSNFIDRINKFEKRKGAQDKGQASLLQPALSPMQNQSPLSTSAPSPVAPVETETGRQDNLFKEDSKTELASPDTNTVFNMDSTTGQKLEFNAGAISPGTAFDMKSKEEKSQSGIKTLLPVRPPGTTLDSSKLDKSKLLDESNYGEKGKEQRKRHYSDYNVDFSGKLKKRQGMQDLVDDLGDLDDSTVDTDKSAFSYRFSRRKSDIKSDENSENSQLNDSRFDKGNTPKGEATKRDNNNDIEEEGVMMMINGELVKLERLRREEIINCTCGVMEEDGLMIQCDVCLCWQHGHCNAIEKEKDVPEKYICYICRHPYRQRPSKKYAHDQEWIKEGKLPSLSGRIKNQEKVNQRTAMLKRSYDLVASLLQIQEVLHSLRVKINVAQKKDHPKLYLWAKNWEKTEVPEANTEPIPVLEYSKSSSTNNLDSISDVSQTDEIKFELPRTVKDDTDVKSIASDTELMKILEEDSTHSEESKITCKNEDLEVQNSGNILLDALTKNGSQQTNASMIDLKNENESSNQSMSMPDTPTPADTPLQQIASPSRVEFDTLAPIQPFIPEPEAPIDPEECRMRLLEHIVHFQNHIDSRLTAIEAQVSALEKMDPDLSPSPDLQPRTKQTVQMLLRDLSTVRKLAALC